MNLDLHFVPGWSGGQLYILQDVLPILQYYSVTFVYV